ncbi:serine hydrolase domain-containing protein [Arenimonas sp. MALMAid1274]|uniref:serine hydrolase domain-containing protein n=1 Tax=Arenimonas sp. MALMAid1274 TaxID=3411630 RepID=UPI003BA1B93F
MQRTTERFCRVLIASTVTLVLAMQAGAATGLPVPAAARIEPAPLPAPADVDAAMLRAMSATGARGLALAVVDGGRVVSVHAHGERNAAGEPLQASTVMYGASLTKTVFAYTVMQLVDEGRLDLDRPIAEYLDRPLPDYPAEDRYGPWPDLASDPRWRRLTARMLLTHSAGFANFAFVEPDGKLRFHFEPGQRYAYSGEGLILLQFVLERGLGLDLGEEMQRRVFAPLGMKDTGMMWRPAFAANLADGWRADGSVEPHDERSVPRAAGSMDTSIADIARFAAALVRGDSLSQEAHTELWRAQRPITTATQFPSLQPELPQDQRIQDLHASLGAIRFTGPQGPGLYKGGHNDSTGNTMVCLQRGQRCVVILSNDVRAEPAFPCLVRAILGDTAVPWRWEYGAMVFTPAPQTCGRP